MVNNLENDLIEKCRLGDHEAFRVLVNKYRKKLFGYCLRMSGNNLIAEDLFQEILIKVWMGIKKYNDRQKFSSWLFTIAHNVIQDWIRQKKKNLNNESINQNVNLTDGGTPHLSFEKDETKILIAKVVMSLPEKQRDVFLLRQQSNMTFKEISIVTNEPVNTVLSHMNYAMKKVKKIIEAEYAENQ